MFHLFLIGFGWGQVLFAEKSLVYGSTPRNLKRNKFHEIGSDHDLSNGKMKFSDYSAQPQSAEPVVCKCGEGFPPKRPSSVLSKFINVSDGEGGASLNLTKSSSKPADGLPVNSNNRTIKDPNKNESVNVVQPTIVLKGIKGVGKMSKGLNGVIQESTNVSKESTNFWTHSNETKNGFTTVTEESEDMNKGQIVESKGLNNVSKGPSDNRTGPNISEKGSPIVQKWLENAIKGLTVVGNGSNDVKQGPTDVSNGLTNVNQGPSLITKGLNNVNQGPTNVSTKLSDVPLDVGKRLQDVNQGTINVKKGLNDVNQGTSNVSKGLNDVNQGTTVSIGLNDVKVEPNEIEKGLSIVKKLSEDVKKVPNVIMKEVNSVKSLSKDVKKVPNVIMKEVNNVNNLSKNVKKVPNVIMKEVNSVKTLSADVKGPNVIKKDVNNVKKMSKDVKGATHHVSKVRTDDSKESIYYSEESMYYSDESNKDSDESNDKSKESNSDSKESYEARKLDSLSYYYLDEILSKGKIKVGHSQDAETAKEILKDLARKGKQAMLDRMYNGISAYSPLYVDYNDVGNENEVLNENKRLNEATELNKRIKAANDDDRIVNGYVVSGRPWYVGVLALSVHLITCGAALLTPRYVLTASHCLCPRPMQDVNRTMDHSQRCLIFHAMQNFSNYRLLTGLSHKSQINTSHAYEIESSRLPSERLESYVKKKATSPFDIALLKTRTTIIFEPRRVMPICLNKEIEDVNVDAVISGFGAFGSLEKKGANKRLSCWTDSRGPNIFSKCARIKGETCKLSDPPASPICKPFFEKYGGPEKFKETERADIAVIGNVSCYPVEGDGGQGWCQTDVSDASKWGYCSIDCKLADPEIREDMMETNIRILDGELCSKMLTSQLGYDPKMELCGGQIITDIHRKVQYNPVTHQKMGVIPNQGVVIGGSDSCQGDSGGPVVTFKKTKAGDYRAVLIGIVSRGNGCAYFNQPGIFTRIKSFYNWIMQSIEPENKCRYV